MASVEVTVEINTEKTKYKLMSCNQTAGQNYKKWAGNKSLKMWQNSNKREGINKLDLPSQRKQEQINSREYELA